MKVVHFSTALPALDSYIDQYNQTVRLALRIRGGLVQTATTLIRLYGKSLEKATSIISINRKNLPSLKTNNCQLAKSIKCSTRTIQRHLQLLTKAGIVTRKLFHGSNSGYELWINPEILSISQQLTPAEAEKAFQATLKKYELNEAEGQLTLEGVTTCPHTDTRDYKNNILIAVENAEKAEAVASADRCSLPLTILSVQTGDPRENGMREEFKSARSGNEKDSARAHLLSMYEELLWVTAKNYLWPRLFFTDDYLRLVKQHIRRLYAPVATEKLKVIHQNYMTRIRLARDWIAKDPASRYAQLPAAWFDPEKLYGGFRGTKIWYEKFIQHRRNSELERLVQEGVSAVSACRNGELQTEASVLQVFRHYEQKIGKKGGPAWAEMFLGAFTASPPLSQTYARAS